MAAATGMHLADNGVTVEGHSGLKQRRKRQFGYLLVDLIGILTRQFVNTDNLCGEVIGTVMFVGIFDNYLSGLIQIISMLFYSGKNNLGIGMFVYPVGRQQKNITLLNRQGLIINFKLFANT